MRYHTLLEAADLPLQDSGRKWEVNVYAFILECDNARQTRGTGALVGEGHPPLTPTPPPPASPAAMAQGPAPRYPHAAATWAQTWCATSS
jgi:hypothetical protein